MSDESEDEKVEEAGKVSRRKFLKAAGVLGASVPLLTSASGLSIRSENPFTYDFGGQSFSFDPSGGLDVGSIQADQIAGGVTGGESLDSLVDSVNGFEASGGGSIASGDAGNLVMTKVADGDTVEIISATHVLADGQAAPTGLNLSLVTLGGNGGGTFRTDIIKGDGNAIYVDVQNASPLENPIASYTNTSGGSQTVAVIVNNGEFGQSGTGSTQTASAYVLGRVV